MKLFTRRPSRRPSRTSPPRRLDEVLNGHDKALRQELLAMLEQSGR